MPCNPLKTELMFRRNISPPFSGPKNKLCLPPFMLVSCLAYSSTLKMKAKCYFETLAYFQRTTRRYISEPPLWELQILHGNCCCLIEVLTRYLSGEDWEKPRKISVKIAGVPPRDSNWEPPTKSTHSVFFFNGFLRTLIQISCSTDFPQSSQILGLYLKIGHDRFLLYFFQSS
jgi:hypothetical protein